MYRCSFDALILTPEPTIARLNPANLRLTLTMATRVTDHFGAPQAGRRFTFTLGGVLPSKPIPGPAPRPGAGPMIVCVAISDANGLASCQGPGTLGALLSLLTIAWVTETPSGTVGTNHYAALPKITF